MQCGRLLLLIDIYGFSQEALFRLHHNDFRIGCQPHSALVADGIHLIGHIAQVLVFGQTDLMVGHN